MAQSAYTSTYETTPPSNNRSSRVGQVRKEYRSPTPDSETRVGVNTTIDRPNISRRIDRRDNRRDAGAQNRIPSTRAYRPTPVTPPRKKPSQQSLKISGTISQDKEEVKAKVKSRARYLLIIGWIVGGIVAVFNTLFILFYSAFSAVENDGAGTVTGVWRLATGFITGNASRAGEGAAILGYSYYADAFLGLMAWSWFMGCIFAVLFLFFALDVLSRTGAKTTNKSIKESLFLAAFVAAFVPFANVWPWANTWIKYVAKHPE